MRMPGPPRLRPGRPPRIPEPWCWCAVLGACPANGPRGCPTPGPNLRQARGSIRPDRHGEPGPRRPQGRPHSARRQAPGTHNAHGGQSHLRPGPGGGVVIIPSALGAQELRDADWKGWSASWVSYARALQPAKPTGFKVLGARAPALQDWIVPRLTGERPAGTPSLTTVFSLIGRDQRAAQEAESDSARSTDPLDGPVPSAHDPEQEHPGPSPSQN